MPTLTIDNQQITVPEGTNVLEAAQRLGIVIPHFCYHEALGAVGSCRLCAMTFVAGPVKGVQMACMVKAQDGMVVDSAEPTAVELRSHVIEWLMINHPHDCPVCDEGGECRLQEMTIAGGHSRRRYGGVKRTYRNQELGPYVAQEMNRCIACYRCLRTYRDYLGGSDFGVFGSRNRLYFGRLADGPLASPFAGNLVDVCPTGVFTDKTFRFKSRSWDLEEAPSLCPHCSLGCATLPGARFRELQRVRAGVNREVNGFFLCDCGRFGNQAVNDQERPRQPLLAGVPASMPEAVTALGTRLQEAVARYGPQGVALVTSPAASLETLLLLHELARRLGIAPPVGDPDGDREELARQAAALGPQAASLAEVRSADLTVVCGADPLAEAPMLAVALRQVVRNGGRVVVIDPRAIDLPCRFTRLPLAAERLAPLLAGLAGAEDVNLEIGEQVILDELTAGLVAASRPVLIGGSLLGAPGAAAFGAALKTRSGTRGMLLLGGPNSWAGGLLAAAGGVETLKSGLAAGRIRALLAVEAGTWPDAAASSGLFDGLELLALLDWRPTAAVRRAGIFLPTRAWVEMDGSYVNNEGRLQAFARVMEPGVPLRQVSPQLHPPREFSVETPGSAAWPAWRILARLVGRSEELAELRRELAAGEPRFAALATAVPGTSGVRLAAGPPDEGAA